MKIELMKTYRTLDKVKQRILQVNALAYNLASERHYVGSSLLYTMGGLHKSLLVQLAADNGGRAVNQRDLFLQVNQLTRVGFLNKEGECYPELIYPLCCYATAPENIRANLSILSKIERFNFIPEFSSWRKFDIYEYRSIEHDDFRCLNIAIHTNNLSIFEERWDYEQQLKIICAYRHLFYGVELDDDWVKSRLPFFQKILCLVKLSYDLGLNLEPISDRDYWLNFFIKLPQTISINSFPLLDVLLSQLKLVFGQFKDIIGQQQINSWAKHYIDATKVLTDGQTTKEAIKFFDLSIREYGEINKRDYWFWPSDSLILYVIGLIRDEKSKKIRTSVLPRIEKLIHCQRLKTLFMVILAILESEVNEAKSLLDSVNSFFINGVEVTSRELLEFAVFAWLQNLIQPNKVELDVLRKKLLLANQLINPLAAAIYAELILDFDPQNSDALDIYHNSPYKGLNVMTMIKVRAPWEYTMDKLIELLASASGEEIKLDTPCYRRLAWLLDKDRKTVIVVEQVLDEGGQWVTTKELPLSRLFRRIDLDFIAKHDSMALLAIEVDQNRKGNYSWNYSRLLLNLVGHPHVYDYYDPRLKLELTKSAQELFIKSVDDGFKLTISYFAKQPGVYLKAISPNKYLVIDISDYNAKLAETIGEDGLIIPKEARKHLKELLARENSLIKVNVEIADDEIITGLVSD